MIIRPFTAADVSAMIQLYQTAFAEDLRASGRTPEDEARRLRAMTWGNLIPFNFAMWLLRKKWGALVAEKDGKVVGGCVHLGGQIFNFMVSPKHQGQGIGQRLIQSLTERVQAQGCPWATADVLETNIASYTVFQRQGFTVCGTAVELELATTRPTQQTAAPAITWRSLKEGDLPALQHIERLALGETRIQAVGSDIRLLRQSIPQAFYNALISNQTASFLFEQAGQIIGFAHANIPGRASKGVVHLCYLVEAVKVQESLLQPISAWFAARGISRMQVVLPKQLAGAWVAEAGENVWSWLYLAKALP